MNCQFLMLCCILTCVYNDLKTMFSIIMEVNSWVRGRYSPPKKMNLINSKDSTVTNEDKLANITSKLRGLNIAFDLSTLCDHCNCFNRSLPGSPSWCFEMDIELFGEGISGGCGRGQTDVYVLQFLLYSK